MIDFSRKDDLVKIYEHYGEEHQLMKLEEEVFELVYEMTHYRNARFNFSEEMCDVIIMCLQFYFNNKILQKMVNQSMNYKINRTLNNLTKDSV